uniref:Nuclear RNA export factor 2 n=1 Tax=Jaculus jaculus TaxID=51337 RepID=A0A8C5LAP5_JACJA
SEENSLLQGRRKDGISSQGNINKMKDCVHTGSLLSKLQEDNETVEMRDHFWLPSRNWKHHKKDQVQCTVYKDENSPEVEMGHDSEDEATASWYRVTVSIPCGRKSDKALLMKSIQSPLASDIFASVFHCLYRIQFFVQHSNTASALKNVSFKICSDESRKISIFVNPSDVPYSVQNKFRPEQMELLKLAMRKRYDVSHQALDLQRFRFDPDLLDCGVDMKLNQRSCMSATLKIIQENFPELLSLNLRNNKLYQLDSLITVVKMAPHVKILNLSKNELKSAWELEKVKELQLEELWLEGNPFCSTFSDERAYDGRKLPTPIQVDTDSPQFMQSCKFVPSTSTSHRYYLIYDYGDRYGLLSAYHDEACFSLTVPLNPSDQDPTFKYDRDMKMLKGSYTNGQLLKYKKHDIVDCLRMLPKTQHDFSSFGVVIRYQTETMLCFSVNGKFKLSHNCFSYSLYIVNDQLLVRDSHSDEVESAFAMTMFMPHMNSNPILSLDQQKMVHTFSTQSGMKLEWSQKCLEDNEWNYTKAAEIFCMLQNIGKIPKEFFRP